MLQRNDRQVTRHAGDQHPGQLQTNHHSHGMAPYGRFNRRLVEQFQDKNEQDAQHEGLGGNGNPYIEFKLGNVNCEGGERSDQEKNGIEGIEIEVQ